jgi:hypothetical protein
MSGPGNHFMNIVDELSKLQSLRAAGAISDAEFQHLKARLLSGGAPPPAAPAPAPPQSSAYPVPPPVPRFAAPAPAAHPAPASGAAVVARPQSTSSMRTPLIALGITGVVVLVGASAWVLKVRHDRQTFRELSCRTTLDSFGRGVVAAYARDKKMPPNATPVPPTLSQVSGKKYQAGIQEWERPGWAQIAEHPRSPEYCQYEWQQTGPNTGVARARADFDGDGSAEYELALPVSCSAPGSCSMGPGTVNGRAEWTPASQPPSTDRRTATQEEETLPPAAGPSSPEMAASLLGQWESRKPCFTKGPDGKFPGRNKCDHRIDVGAAGIKCAYTKQWHSESSEDTQNEDTDSYKFDSIDTRGNTSTVHFDYGGKKVAAKLVLLSGGQRMSVSGLPDDDCNGTFYSSTSPGSMPTK